MNWKDFAILKALLGNGGGGGSGSGAKYPDKVTIITESRELTAHDQGIVFVTGQTVTLPSVAADGTTYKFVGSPGDVIINTKKTIAGIGSGAAIRLGDSYTEIYAINSPGLSWDVRSRSTVGAYTTDKTYKKGDIATDSGLHYLSIADENVDNALSETTKWLPLTTDIAAQTNAASAKNPPVDADIMPLADSANSFTLKKLTFANLFLWIITKVAALASKTTPVNADAVLLRDSEASDAPKWLTFTNLKAFLKTYFDTLYAPVTTIITAPVAWTPTFTGAGSVTNITAYSWRVGSLLHFEIRFTSGTGTATEARVSLGFNGIDGNVTTASTYPSLQHVGDGVSNTATSGFVLLAEASKTYLCFGIQDGSAGSRAGLSKRNGDVLFASGWVNTLRGAVRIQGW